jgi:hypothetical protein
VAPNRGHWIELRVPYLPPCKHPHNAEKRDGKRLNKV